MKKFYRSTSDQKIAGICGGIGEMLNIDSNIIRLFLILATLLSGFFPFVVTYILAWILFPEDSLINENNLK